MGNNWRGSTYRHRNAVQTNPATSDSTLMTDWLRALLARKPFKVAAVALAKKMARMAWALMARGELYRRPAARAAAA